MNSIQSDPFQKSPVTPSAMNARIQRLRKLSFEAEPSISIERAMHQTAFYKANNGKYSVPVMRALQFLDHCEKKTIYIGCDELIVGERGPQPKAVPTFPELTCHSAEFLRTLHNQQIERLQCAWTRNVGASPEPPRTFSTMFKRSPGSRDTRFGEHSVQSHSGSIHRSRTNVRACT